jgi:2-iminobutanoate/2-iminopropanoate deaminase
MHFLLARVQADFSDVIKTTIYLKNIEDFDAVNEVYGQCFTGDLPARAAFQVNKFVNVIF